MNARAIVRLVAAAAFTLASTGCSVARFHHAPAPNLLGSELRAHLEFLAGDAMNGRGSGTRDEQLAAEYVGNYFRSIGLESIDGFGQFVQQADVVRRTLAEPPVLVAGVQRWTHGNEILVTSNPPLVWTGSLLHLKSVAPEEIALVVPGSIVVLSTALTTADADAVGQLFRSGAVAVLTPETPQARARWATLGARPPSFDAKVAIMRDPPIDRPGRIILSSETAAEFRQIPDGTPISLETREGPNVESHTWNAVALLKGSDPKLSEQTILVSAHLDHLGHAAVPGQADGIYNGADDDASGTVAVMAIAKALASGPRPRRSVMFAAFGSEEAGGLGAAFFLERLPVALSSLVANIQFEMIGRPDPAVAANTLWLTGFNRSTLGPALAAHGASLVADPHPAENFFQRSDNYALAVRGVVAHTVSSYGLHSDYHQPSDDLSHIDWPHLQRSVASLVTPIRWLANATFVPEWLPNGRP